MDYGENHGSFPKQLKKGEKSEIIVATKVVQYGQAGKGDRPKFRI